MPDLTPETVAELRRLLDAATPGPWFWWGNTDNHSVALCGRQPGLGVCEVISTLNVARSTNGRDADQQREGMRDAGYTATEITEAIEEWAEDDWGPRTDARLSITDEHYIRRTADELAVYEVARAQGLPDDTPRDHPKVYRADVCDLRAPNARFIVAAVNALPALLDAAEERDALRAECDALREQLEAMQSTDGLSIMLGWLVYKVGEHTCGGYGPESNYMHEPGCGYEPILDLSKMEGWPGAERDALAAKVARVENAVERALRHGYDLDRYELAEGLGIRARAWPHHPRAGRRRPARGAAPVESHDGPDVVRRREDD